MEQTRKLLIIGAGIGVGRILEHQWPSPLWAGIACAGVCLAGIFVVELVRAGRADNWGREDDPR